MWRHGMAHAPSKLGHKLTEPVCWTKTTAREETFESGVGPVGVPFGIDRQKDHVNVSRGDGFVKPLEHRLWIAEAGVYERPRIRRHVPLAGEDFQPAVRAAV